MGVITIDRDDFTKGASTADGLADGGFSPLSKGIRPVVADYTGSNHFNYSDGPGYIRTQANETDLSDNLEQSKPIINMLNVEQSGTTYDVVFVTQDAAAEASFWGWTGSLSTPPTKQQTDSTGSEQYNSLMKTQMVWYESEIFCANNTNIQKLTATLSSMTENWWTVTAGGAALNSFHAHPMIVWNNRIYIGNNNSLAEWDGTTATDVKLSLPGDAIISLGVDNSTGNLLIGTNSSYNASGTNKLISKIFVWDGTSIDPNRSITVEDRVTSFYTMGGITYVFYGTNLGYWNGQGITHIRRLNIGYSSGSLIYYGKVTDLDGTLYIAEGENILAYGPITQGGKKIFYYPFFASSGRTLGGVKAVGAAVFSGNSRPYIATWYDDSEANPKLEVFNPYDSICGNNNKFYTNKYFLPSNSRIKKVEVITEKLASGDGMDVHAYLSSDESFSEVGSMSYASDGAITQKTMGKNKSIETAIAQLKFSFATGTDAGIKQIKVHYESIEKEL